MALEYSLWWVEYKLTIIISLRGSLMSQLCIVKIIKWSELVVFWLYSIGFCEDLIQTLSQKTDMLKSVLIFTSILITFIHPSLKRSQQQSVSCGGICDFSFSVGLLIYSMFLILKMVYPMMNPVYWLIPAGTASMYMYGA